jgi:hypothetical protein
MKTEASDIVFARMGALWRPVESGSGMRFLHFVHKKITLHPL